MEEKEKLYSQGEGAMRNANELNETMRNVNELNEMMLYPIIKTKEEVEEMLNSRNNENLNVERLNHMIRENKTLKELIQRYACVRNSWGEVDSVVNSYWFCYNVVNGN